MSIMKQSTMGNLSYDIEQLYIEGHSPKMIATILECPVEIVYSWMEAESLGEDQSYDPYETVNS
jgi:hypothetical protein